MKTDFKFSNLLGTVYCKGNLLFTPDGTCLLSPVGNRVTVFDLVHNTSYTLPLAHRRNIARLALSPAGNLLLSVDEDGRGILSHFNRRIVLYYLTFRSNVSALAFSPSGKHFAIGAGRFVEVWHTPSTPDTNENGELDFAPFVKHHTHASHYDTIKSISWSSDSRFFLSTSKDLTCRIWSVDPEDGFIPTTLTGHRQALAGAWFSDDQEIIYTVSRDGALFEWKYVSKQAAKGEEEEDEENSTEGQELSWRITQRHFFMQDKAHVTCATFHAPSKLLVTGFSNGIFGLYELPEFHTIHNLSISQHNIDFVDVNKSGEWLAFGASELGQLLVWEWQSESYILKQQGHFDSMNTVIYSSDGQRIITAADDGKIKAWDVKSGFCIVTFTEHTSGVTACEFAKRGNVLFTASLDGSVRAWDLMRYRNFRTFTAPTRLSFSCLAVDPSGEVICAGSVDSFDIYTWSVQTGQLLDELAGHEGPVSSLAFTSDGNSLVSGSWDNTVRIWNIFARTQNSEPFQLQADVLCVAIRPDSKQVAISTLDGNLTFWSISEATQQGGLDARRDVSGGRKLTDRRTAANAAGTKSFNTVVYSSDGTCVLAGGNSKYVCLYDVQSGVLLKKFTVSVNLSLDGTQEFLNSKNLTEAGPKGLIDDQGEASDLEERLDSSLPGAKRGRDAALRTTRREVRVPSLAFSPTGRAFCAASTEGLLIYSLDDALQFDPFDLDTNITPSSILATLSNREYMKALVMAFRLNETSYMRYVYGQVPAVAIPLLVRGLPVVYLARLLRFVALATDETPHLEFNLLWIESILSEHGRYLKDNTASFAAELRLVQRAVKLIHHELGRLADENGFVVDYLLQSRGIEANNKRDVDKTRYDERGDLTIEQIMEGMGAVNGQINGNGSEVGIVNADDDSEGDWMGMED